MDFTLIREFIVEVDENAIICSLAPSSDIMRKPLPEVDSLKQMSARNIHCLFVMLVGGKARLSTVLRWHSVAANPSSMSHAVTDPVGLHFLCIV